MGRVVDAWSELASDVSAAKAYKRSSTNVPRLQVSS